MRFIDKFVRKVEGVLQDKAGDRPLKDIDALRQGSPPDEREAEIAECAEAAEAAEVTSSSGPVEHKKAAGR